jgi:hypothetical protein
MFFGVLVALNLQTSFLTPPMAMSAYYLKGIAPPHVQLTEIFAGCCPSSAWCSSPWSCLHLPADRVLAAGGVLRPALGSGWRRKTSDNWLSDAVDAARAIRDGADPLGGAGRGLPRAHREREPRCRRWALARSRARAGAGARATTGRSEGRPLGPLHGLPVGVKDIIDTADMPTEDGTPLHAGRTPRARRCDRRAAARGGRDHPGQDGDHGMRLLLAGQDAQPAQPGAHAGRLVLERLGGGGRRRHGAARARHARPTAR